MVLKIMLDKLVNDQHNRNNDIKPNEKWTFDDLEHTHFHFLRKQFQIYGETNSQKK